LDLTNQDLSYLAGWEQIPGLELGRRYKNAPIVEAIVEFRVTTEGLRLERLAELDFGEQYGSPETVYTVEQQVQLVDGELSAETHDSQVGFSFSTEDAKRTVQATASTFGFVWRGEYTQWGDFIAEVEGAWETYRAVAAPTFVDAIGVRFVNHIPMPLRPIEIKDYLRMSVDIPAQLPQTLTSLFVQVDIPLPKQHAQATVTSTVLGGTADQPGGWLVLDIDAKAPVGADTSNPVFGDTITATLDKLRLAKNYVFEACVTDATRGLMD